jgi:DNA-binding NarL/FixJ family response regulator
MDGTTNARTTRVPVGGGTAIAELTTRELDVLTLIGQGLSNTEIAGQLFISGVTVKSHIGRIFGKLDLRDRAAAIVYAYDNGIDAPR